MNIPKSLILICLLSCSTVLAQTETGTDDFRITIFGPDGTNDFGAILPEVAYNSTNDEYLVVFLANTDQGPTAPTEAELWAQRISAQGLLLGNPQLITDVDGLGADGARPTAYRVIYIPSRNGYFVAYSAFDAEFGDTTFRIYGLFLSAAGLPVGEAFQPTSGGTNVANQRGELSPDMAYNSIEDEIFLVWERSNDIAEAAVYARALAATDGSARTPEVQVDSIDVFSVEASVAHNPDENQYLVHWRRGFAQATMFQILDAEAQTQLASDRELASPGFFSSKSSVAYDPMAQQYLVVWANSDPALGMANGAYEIFGRRVAANGNLLGSDKFRISQSAGIDANAFGANIACTTDPCLTTARPGLDYSEFDKAFVVSWSSSLIQTDPNQAQALQEDNLVRLIRSGQDVQADLPQVQISNAGGEELGYFARYGVVAANPNGGYLISWWGDDNRNGVNQGETEVWGQLLQSILIFNADFETP